MPPDIAGVLADVRAEMDDVDRVVQQAADLDAATPAEGWSIRDTVCHLAKTDESAIRAITDPDGFSAALADVFAEGPSFIDRQIAEAKTRPDLLDWWREQRAELLDLIAGVDPAHRIAWYGPPMGPASFATARLMEYWAHGLDIADAAGVVREPTARLRHIAHIGWRTRGFSYAVRGLDPPADDIFVSLTGPGGETWAYGDPTATDRVTGPALDFCLLVTQRRHLDDLALDVRGPLAEEWLAHAQCYAGLPATIDPHRKGMSH